MVTQDRHGYYLVGWKKFYNKTQALIYASENKFNVRWVFNDEVYDKINWQTPIETSLFELYRQRAQQLRDKYDYLVLYFSGGADSTNILRTFIDNDIFLDEIVMQYPKPVESQFDEKDKSNKNIYGEIKYQAIPTLNNLNIHSKTQIRYQDFAQPLLDLLSKDNWFDIMPMGTNISPAGIGRQIAQVKEDHILRLCDSGKKVAQILGVDKPLVLHTGDDYFAYFSDVSAMHSPPVDATQSEIFNKLYCTEFFYWTPDLPEIVVKQAQLIKQFCLNNPQATNMIMQSMKKHIQHYRSLLHSIIYYNDIQITWDPEKPDSKVVRPMDNWFWETATPEVNANYMDVIKYLESHTDSKYMIENNIYNGISAHNSKFYKL